jgi:hypothetical protein
VRLHLVALLLVVAAPAAQADPIMPAGEVAGVAHRPAGALGDELGDGWAMRLEAGIARGRFALEVPFEIGSFDSRKPERDTDSLLSMGTGVGVVATLVQVGTVGLRARAGYQWRWLSGQHAVTRRCHEVGGCDGGYWSEEPAYLLHGPLAGVAATWSARFGEARGGFALEARVERASVELPGTGDVSGPLVAIALTMWMSAASPP